MRSADRSETVSDPPLQGVAEMATRIPGRRFVQHEHVTPSHRRNIAND